MLTDFCVLELSEEPAGAFCGKAFADLGAEVVKVEPPAGDRLRACRGAFLHLNTNKRSVVLDPDETNTFKQLVRRAHIVVESAGWGDLASWGIGADDLRVELPALVVATISGFGLHGPYAGYRWTDLVGQAAGWATLPAAYSEKDHPVKLPGIVGLCLTGQTAALGALAAALRASASGQGTRLDCAMFEALGAVPSRVSRWLGWQYNRKRVTHVLSAGASSVLLPNGLFPCADGYVSLQATPQQLPAILDVLGNDDLRAAFAHPDAYVRGETKEIFDAALYPWLLCRTRTELTAIAQAAGWPFTGVNSPSEVLHAPHLHQRGYWVAFDHLREGRVLLPGPPYRHREGGWRLQRGAPALGENNSAILGRPDQQPIARRTVRWRGPTDPAVPPLEGVRVIDFTVVWAGPYATQLLSDLGAEVIRVENPSIFPPSTKGYQPRPNTKMMFGGLLAGYGPPVDGRPDRPYNRHSMNNSVARNKLSCTLDPRRPEARELLFQLVERSDVFIESMKVSALRRLGIEEAELLDRNPRLIVLRIPPAGLTGDWSGYKGLGAQFDGLSGLSWLSGHHDQELLDAPPAIYMDAATGPAAAFAVLAALHFRNTTGRGQLVEMSQLENVIGHIGDVLVDLQLGVEPQRRGNRDRHWAPQGIYQCRGQFRWVALSVTTDEEWARLAEVVGGKALGADDRYRRAADRLARHDELDGMLADWAGVRDVMDAFHIIQAAGVPAAPILVDDLLEGDPHVAAREWLRPLSSTDVGTYPHIGHAFRGIPQTWKRGSPVLGEDNRYVFQDILGLDGAAYSRLVDARIAVEDYLDPDGQPV
jgi:crotonobetainyl-CoA:carnitine CoA-transferase CaiB-like acyl-CoA transferase